MPSLEDTPKLVAKTAPSGSDLIAIHDMTEVGNSRIKKATVLQLVTEALAALPGPFTDDAAASAGGVSIGYPYILDQLPLAIVLRAE